MCLAVALFLENVSTMHDQDYTMFSEAKLPCFLCLQLLFFESLSNNKVSGLILFKGVFADLNETGWSSCNNLSEVK